MPGKSEKTPTSPKVSELKVRLVCTNLPGTTFSDGKNAYENIHLGIQEGEAIVDAVPGDTKRVVFEPAFRVAPLPGGKTNFLGPFAKGTPQERFFYLSWAEKKGGKLTMFRRAKIQLSHLPWSRVKKAVESGEPLKVELSMTGKRGDPLCASVGPGLARWDG